MIPASPGPAVAAVLTAAAVVGAALAIARAIRWSAAPPRRIASPDSTTASSSPRASRSPRASPVAGVGARIRRIAASSGPDGSAPEPDPGADRRVGRWAALVVVAAVVGLAVPAIAAAFAVFARSVFVRRRRRRRLEAAVVRELPEVIDLIRLALSSGGSVLLGIGAVAARPLGPLGAELAAVVVRVERGHRVADALDELPDRLGEAVRPLVRGLVASERYGVELGPTLERLAGEARDDRRRRAQTEARRVPVRMLLPLVLGVLPAFVLLTLVPTLLSTFDRLDLG